MHPSKKNTELSSIFGDLKSTKLYYAEADACDFGPYTFDSIEELEAYYPGEIDYDPNGLSPSGREPGSEYTTVTGWLRELGYQIGVFECRDIGSDDQPHWRARLYEFDAVEFPDGQHILQKTWDRRCEVWREMDDDERDCTGIAANPAKSPSISDFEEHLSEAMMNLDPNSRA